MTSGGMVIIGGGKAGARACVALRENGWEGAVTLISDEHLAPYDRPPLSKSVITEEDEQSPPFLTDEPLLASINVTFIKGMARSPSTGPRSASPWPTAAPSPTTSC